MTRPPTQKELDLMRRELVELSGERTKPGRWQTFFEDRPFAFSSSLSLSASGASVEPTNDTRPDVILYAHGGGGPPRFGMLELAWHPNDSTSPKPRRSLLLLPDVETALEGCRDFVIQGEATLQHANRNVLCIGNDFNLLVVTGMDQQTCDALDKELDEKLNASQPLPEGLERPSFETLAELFAAKVPPEIVLLAPCAAIGEGDTPSVLERLRTDFDRKAWEASRCG
jgi:hypothetical protein